MKTYEAMNAEELKLEHEKLLKQYGEAKELGMSLDMSRGKPSVEQLDTVMPMMDVLTSEDILKSEAGLDCRNYGGFDGLPEAKKLMADMMGVKSADNVIVYGNSSLNIMYDTVSRSYTHGVMGSTPWCRLEKVKFLCPVPGYDRHFSVTEHFGIEMIQIPLHDDGPDMDLVEQYVGSDETVKGIWCVPKYSNPGGVVYSDAVVRRLAALSPAAEDFRIYWDNAYVVHNLYPDTETDILDILSECEKAGNPDMVYEFASTSKVSFAGSGIAALASSVNNLTDVKKSLTMQTIGFDKINQLRHVRYYKNLEGIKAQMRLHADILRPKFETVLNTLEDELGDLGIADWSKPKGGYFICFETMEGCAAEVVKRCKEAGVTLTGAGAPFPHKKDPKDSIIRLAPSCPTPEELEKATDIFVLCVKLVTVEHLITG